MLQVASLNSDHNLAQTELDSARLKMKECDSQISSILKEQQGIQHKLSETALEKKRMENEVIYLIGIYPLALGVLHGWTAFFICKFFAGKTHGNGTERLLC